MELDLQLDENTILSLRMEGLDGFVNVSSGSVSAARLPGTRIESSLPSSSAAPVKRKPGRPRKDEAFTIRETPAAYGLASGVSKAANDPPASPESMIPVEIYQYPKKHQDFFHRKYRELLEIYPVERARELALEAVRSVAGPS